LSTTLTKLAINSTFSQKLFKVCSTGATLTHAAETTPLRLLHNDVPRPLLTWRLAELTLEMFGKM